jgi:hypothetical protein
MWHGIVVCAIKNRDIGAVLQWYPGTPCQRLITYHQGDFFTFTLLFLLLISSILVNFIPLYPLLVVMAVLLLLFPPESIIYETVFSGSKLIADKNRYASPHGIYLIDWHNCYDYDIRSDIIGKSLSQCIILNMSRLVYIHT